MSQLLWKDHADISGGGGGDAGSKPSWSSGEKVECSQAMADGSEVQWREERKHKPQPIKFQMTSPQKRRQSLKLTSSQIGIFCAALLLRQLCRYVPVDADTQKLEFIKASNFDQCQKGCWLLAYGLHLCDGGLRRPPTGSAWAPSACRQPRISCFGKLG